MQDPNSPVIPEAAAPVAKVFVNKLTQARDKLQLAGTLNGKVIKPFKATAGKRELFVVNEQVTVTERTVEETNATFYIVNGLAYNHKTTAVKSKIAQFTPEQLSKYVAYNG